MPRYFFHLESRDSRVTDEEGMALPDPEAAWYQAVRSAREVIRADLAIGCSWSGQALEVADEQGKRVLRMPLEEVAQYSL